MVFQNERGEKWRQHGFEHELYRAKQHMKEDYKPISTSSNTRFGNDYKSIVFNSQGTARDLLNEDSNFAIRYVKKTLLGAAGGALFGFGYEIFMPTNEWARRKLHHAIDGGPYSGKMIKLWGRVMAPYMAGGMLTSFSYFLIKDFFLGHHESPFHTVGRPEFLNQWISSTIVAGGVAFFLMGLRYIPHAMGLSAFGIFPALKVTQIFLTDTTEHNRVVIYEKGVTDAEKEKFAYQD